MHRGSAESLNKNMSALLAKDGEVNLSQIRILIGS